MKVASLNSRAFLIVAAGFIFVGFLVNAITTDGKLIRDTWITVAITLLFLAAWSFIGRKKR
jgi:hypothetical protein